jgi:superfamily II DNA/RNA helicase
MALLIGGVQMGDQVKALEKGVDVLIATPGRLMDLFQRGKILLNGCSLLVIDEADRMLDMGFIPDIEEICTKLPAARQTLLFSATMPPPIKKLADKFLANPKTIEVARPATTNVNITQWLVPVRGPAVDKRDTLRRLLGQEEVRNAIIFCNRKTTVRELNKSLKGAGFASGEIHGDMDQPARLAELDKFKKGEVSILVASDVAARGLDIKGVSHVFNFDAPWHPDDYVHRIGRTGRAGASGVAYTFVGPDDVENIENIEKLTGQTIQRLDAVPAANVGGDDGAGAARGGTRRRPSRSRDAERAAAPVAAPVAAPDAAPEPVAAAAPPRDDERAERPRQERTRDDRAATPPRRDDTPRNAARGDGRREDDGRQGEQRDQRRGGQRGDYQRHDGARRGGWNDRDDGPDDGWNGPVPDFLGVALTR